MVGPYDLTTKECLGEDLSWVVSWVSDGCEPARVENVPTELRELVEKHVDTVNRVYFADREPELLHIEIQSTNDPNMAGRMYLYGGMLYAEHKEMVLSIVIYIGNDPMNMKNEIKKKHISGHTSYFRFIPIDIRRFPADFFLRSESPATVIWALLTRADDYESLIERIIHRLVAVTASNPAGLPQYVARLRIFGQLRKVEDLVHTILSKTMGISIILEKDPLYRMGATLRQEEFELLQKEVHETKSELEKKDHELEKNKSELEKKNEELAELLQQQVNLVHLMHETLNLPPDAIAQKLKLPIKRIYYCLSQQPNSNDHENGNVSP